MIGRPKGTVIYCGFLPSMSFGVAGWPSAIGAGFADFGCFFANREQLLNVVLLVWNRKSPPCHGRILLQRDF
jgi:hypothetical protein